MKKITFFSAIFLVAGALNLSAQNLLYSNDFEQGAGDATIVGNGVIENAADARFGKVFHNAAGGQAIRSNYLLLPNTIFASLQAAESNALTISFWVNKGTATDYWFSPIFSAYGATPNPGNTWPMMVLQSRQLMQINCAGWCDFTNSQNAAGQNAETTFWLDDAAWHLYTAVVTPTNAKVYIDAVVVNEWNIANDGLGGNVVSGIFTNGADLTYICLGGNQAWDWPDPDPAYLFDNLKIYSDALTQEQITAMYQTFASADENKIDNFAATYNKNTQQITISAGEGTLYNANGQAVASSLNGVIGTQNLTAGVYVVRAGEKVQKVMVY